jgi:sialate O-acetylesterase
MIPQRLLLPSAILLASIAAHADVTLSPIIGSHMVLQQKVPCPIWGWAEAGEEVTVEFAGQKKTAKPGEGGKWMVKLDALKASSEPQTMTIKGKNEVKLEDVLVGEVWLCSGQSNMEMTVGSSQNGPQEANDSAKYPQIRHLKINNRPEAMPTDKVTSDGWKVASPQTTGNFTGVGYFFAREIANDQKVPVGLLGSNWGGTRIEPWTPPVGFQKVPALKEITDKLDGFSKGKVNEGTPTALYNGRIAPLVPFAIKGALWYQGESNVGEGMLYFEKKKALIDGWRQVWEMPEMPFYFAQIAPYNYGPASERLPRLWEAETATLKIPHTGMAVLMDIGNVKDIHPKNKQEVGRRLALWALAKDYGKKDVVFSGPLYKAAKFTDGKATLTFEYGAGLKTRDGKTPSHFVIAGEDQKFVPAKAEIVGDTVVVSGEGVAKPVAVRYGWAQDAEPNLANGAGLPASAFRTDDWAAK